MILFIYLLATSLLLAPSAHSAPPLLPSHGKSTLPSFGAYQELIRTAAMLSTLRPTRAAAIAPNTHPSPSRLCFPSWMRPPRTNSRPPLSPPPSPPASMGGPTHHPPTPSTPHPPPLAAPRVCIRKKKLFKEGYPLTSPDIHAHSTKKLGPPSIRSIHARASGGPRVRSRRTHARRWRLGYGRHMLWHRRPRRVARRPI